MSDLCKLNQYGAGYSDGAGYGHGDGAVYGHGSGVGDGDGSGYGQRYPHPDKAGGHHCMAAFFTSNRPPSVLAF